MTKKVFVVGLVLVIFTAIGVGIYFFLKNTKDKTAPAINSSIAPLVTTNNQEKARQVCNKINDEGERNFCLAKVNQDEKLCKELDEPVKNVCLAEIKKDFSYCNKMPADNKMFCCQNLVSALGVATYCDELKEDQQIATCYVHFISTNYFAGNTSVINVEMCEKIPKGEPEHNYCLAIANQDIKYCSASRNDCQALFSTDVSICDNSTSGTDKAECYHVIAMTSKNPLICEKITQEDMKNNCYVDFARLISDESICDKIYSQGEKNTCLTNIALSIIGGK